MTMKNESESEVMLFSCTQSVLDTFLNFSVTDMDLQLTSLTNFINSIMREKKLKVLYTKEDKSSFFIQTIQELANDEDNNIIQYYIGIFQVGFGLEKQIVCPLDKKPGNKLPKWLYFYIHLIIILGISFPCEK